MVLRRSGFEKIEVSSLEPVTIVWDTFGDVMDFGLEDWIKRVPDFW